MRQETAQALRDAYGKPRRTKWGRRKAIPPTPLPARPPTPHQAVAGDLKRGSIIRWAHQRVAIQEIAIVGYGWRRGAAYRRLRMTGTLIDARDETIVTIYTASDDKICR